MHSKVPLSWSVCIVSMVGVVFSLVVISSLAHDLANDGGIPLMSALSLPNPGGAASFINHRQAKKNMSYHTNIIKDTKANENFRRVLFTGQKSQLVVMSVPPGGEVGEETHKFTEQTLFFLSGTGEGALDDKVFPIGPGDVVVVTPGTKHNFWNTGLQALKIYTVYAPPNHIDGRVHPTKADADADMPDEAVGESAPAQ